MKRSTTIMVALIAALLAGACSPAPIPTPTNPPRTPVPTWTLSFDPFTTTPSPPPPTGTPEPASPVPPSATAPPTLPPDTPTLFPTASPTARPGIDPTLGAATPDPAVSHELPIPEAMPQLHLDDDIVNILLLGRDTERGSNAYRTDVMIIVSINKSEQAVTMLTIPRDLFVYVPGWTMNRINTAAGRGDAVDYPGGGVALLEQTILYNLGIPIHGWARVDFQGFKNVVDIVGGVDVPVSCAMQDWRLKDPTLDQQVVDNWQLYTVETGMQHMDGDLALWYARSRKRSSDFDRSRRQHQVLRAMFEKALQLRMLTKVPELYGQYIEVVDTDLGLGDLLQFVPMATQMDRARIKSRFIGREHVFPYTTSKGAAVLLPNREAISALLAEAFVPPSGNVLAREAPAVEIWNGTANADWAALAADNLAWAGVTPVIGQADRFDYSNTVIYDFTTSAKGSAIKEIQRIFSVRDENVIAQPNAEAAYPFRVVLGSDYNSCVRPQSIIRTTATPWAPGAVPQGENILTAAAVLEPPPGIEGDLGEWAVLPYPIAEPLSGQQDWEGANDLSAKWNAAWDEYYLYLAVEVKDNTFAQNSRGEAMQAGDGLEIWFDADLTADRTNPTLSGDDFILGLSPGNLISPVGGPEAYLWQPENETRTVQDVVVTAQLADGGYDVEIAIPWTVFRVGPAAGRQFGLALALNDDDSGGGMLQTQLTNRKDQKRDNPTTWGVLVLGYPPGP